MSVPLSVIIVIIIILVILCFLATDPKIYIFTLLMAMLVTCGYATDKPEIVSDGIIVGGGKITQSSSGSSIVFEPGAHEELRAKLPKYNKPQTAQYDKLRGCAVTKKLDGMRVILFANEDVLWAISDKGVAQLNKPSSMPNGTILDTEYFEDIFYIFDAMFIGCSQGTVTDVRNFNLDYRMNCVAIMELGGQFKIKEHVYSGDLQADVAQMVKSCNEKIDGLIFTEINGKYDSVVYKAKPKELMTIDFAIGNNGALMVYLRKDPLILKQFNGFTLHNLDPKYKVGDVVECSWHDNHFEILRRRDDKAGVPNHEKTAISTLEQLKNPNYPATYADIVIRLRSYAVGGRSEQIRKFHNTIKRRLVNIYCCNPNTVVYDIGIGRGGDIAKYKAVGVKKIIGIEPNKSGYIEELKRRSSNLGYQVVELDATNAANSTGLLWKNVGIEEFDVSWLANISGEIIACSFFSLGFFFDKPDHIDQLISKLGKAKRFIGCTIDGQQMRKLGRVKNDIFETSPINATSLKFHMTGDTTVQDQTEYYVDWPLFIEKMKDNGFEIVEDELFTPPKYFNKDQALFSSLYRRFVFERRI